MRAAGYAILWTAVCLVIRTHCHQQCLDSLPPFVPTETAFCSEYDELSCCTGEENLNIQRKYYDIINELEKNQGVVGCRAMLRQVMCLQCHPFALHLYEAELSITKRPLPGLCGVFCKDFYDSCQQAIPLLTEDEDTRSSASSQAEFCEHIAAEDERYCYPDLNNDPELQYNISREGTTVDGCMCLDEIASGLRNPIQIQESPDGTGRLFIAEQKGLIHIYYPNKTHNSEPFMNLSSAVHLSSAVADEKGFLAFVFHPKYATNRRFFVYYFIYHEGADKTRLSEFRAAEDDENMVDEDSERVLLDIPQPYQNHNGGWLGFDPDGYLYLSLGDGGQQGDPHNYAQNLSSLHGKLLRIDVDSTPAEGEEYVIPPDNPFQNVHDGRPEIYAYGFRSNWRCDIDEGDRETEEGRGQIICSDNGQSTYEEINLVKRGGNYGWNVKEGFACYNENELCGQLDDEELPIHVYDHTVGQSVISGPVYRGCRNPSLNGKLIYGDFVNGRMWTLKQSEVTKKWKSADLKTCGPDVCYGELTGTYPQNIFSFGEDYAGEVYMLTTLYASSDAQAGKVFKIVDPRIRGDPATCRTNQPPEDNNRGNNGGKGGASVQRSLQVLFIGTSMLLSLERLF